MSIHDTFSFACNYWNGKHKNNQKLKNAIVDMLKRNEHCLGTKNNTKVQKQKRILTFKQD